MKTLKIAAFILLAFATALLLTGWWYGAFRPVIVQEREMGPMTVAYHEQIGDYSQTPHTIEEVEVMLRGRGVEPLQGFGMYFDNPRVVAREKLRSDVGAVVADSDRRRLRDPKRWLKLKALARGKCLAVEMPYRGPLSIWVGILRAYPALAKAAAGRSGAAPYTIEIYERGKSILYLIPVK